MQRKLFKNDVRPDDIVYTPDAVAFDIVNYFKPSGLCLDPCSGDGVFLKYLPKNSDSCEVRNGLDFFDYRKSVDWIVGNPPYSIFVDFLKHSFKIAKNVVYIVPTNKIFQSFKVMDQISQYGGIKAMLVYGGGLRVGFPFGFSIGAFHFEKDYTGKTQIEFRQITQHWRRPTLPSRNIIPSRAAQLYR